MEACGRLEACGFFKKYSQSLNLECRGFIRQYCEGTFVECKRLEYRNRTGSPPPDDMMPSGQMLTDSILHVLKG